MLRLNVHVGLDGGYCQWAQSGPGCLQRQKTWWQAWLEEISRIHTGCLSHLLRRMAGLHLKQSCKREIQIRSPKAYGRVSFTQIGAESRGLTKKLFIKVAVVLSEVQFCNKGWCTSVTYEFPNDRLCLSEKTWDAWKMVHHSAFLLGSSVVFFYTTLEFAAVGCLQKN